MSTLLTDGILYFTEPEPVEAFNARDGTGLRC